MTKLDKARPDLERLASYKTRRSGTVCNLARYALSLEAALREESERAERLQPVVDAARAHVEARRDRGPTKWPQLLAALTVLAEQEKEVDN